VPTGRQIFAGPADSSQQTRVKNGPQNALMILLAVEQKGSVRPAEPSFFFEMPSQIKVSVKKNDVSVKKPVTSDRRPESERNPSQFQCPYCGEMNSYNVPPGRSTLIRTRCSNCKKSVAIENDVARKTSISGLL
jgi:predicted RNA-binding Zn-ribbon protein involved in translation (DUF1610 family)